MPLLSIFIANIKARLATRHPSLRPPELITFFSARVIGLVPVLQRNQKKSSNLGIRVAANISRYKVPHAKAPFTSNCFLKLAKKNPEKTNFVSKYFFDQSRVFFVLIEKCSSSITELFF